MSNESYNWGTPPFPKYPHETVDSMAEIGEAFMDAMPKGYVYSQSPAEIIADLTNERDDALALLDERFRMWDIVANRRGSQSTQGCPLRSGGEAYTEAVVTSLSPFVLVSLEGDMRWDRITPEERADLRVVREGTIGEVCKAYNRMHRDAAK